VVAAVCGVCLFMDGTGKINNYFPPVSSSVKRARTISSPEGEDIGASNMTSGDDKVGELTNNQLINMLSTLLDNKLANLATKEDVGRLTGQVSQLTEENERLKLEVKGLKLQEKKILDKLTDLESRSRRNNLIFRGLEWGKHLNDFKGLVSRFCAENLGTGGNLWVNRAHPLGKSGDAIIAHFPQDDDIEYIMSRAKVLKGTKYKIHRDFPWETRKRRAMLAGVRAEVQKVVGQRRMPLAVDRLVIDGCRFSWENDKLLAGRQDGIDRLKQMFNHDFTEAISRVQNQESSTRANYNHSGEEARQMEVITEAEDERKTSGDAPHGRDNTGRAPSGGSQHGANTQATPTSNKV